jgi:hypothetical protein
VFFAVAVVGKSDDVKIAKARGQFRDGFDMHADFIPAQTFALMTAIFFNEFLNFFVC